MRLTRLAARDFMAFESLDLDFSRIEEAVLVGKNGAGKSSLFDVLRYALYGKQRYRSVDQNIRDQPTIADSLWTSVEFETPLGQHVRVERSKGRGKTADVHLWVDDAAASETLDPSTGKVTQHTNRETDADIAALVGLPYETMLAGPWMAQKDAGLTAFDPTDGMRLLVKLFDAEWCAPLHDAAKAQAAATEAGRRSAQEQVDRLTALVAHEPELLASRERGRALRDDAAAERDVAQEALGAVKERLVASRTRIERHSALEAAEQRLTASIRQADNDRARIQSLVDAADMTLASPEPMSPEFAEPDTAALAAAEDELLTARAAETRAARLHAEAEALDRDWRREVQRHDVLGTVPCGGEGVYAACPFLVAVPRQDALDAMRQAVEAKVKEEHLASAAAATVGTLDGAVRRIQAEVREVETTRSRVAHAIEVWRYQRDNAVAIRDQHTATIASLKDRLAADRSALEATQAERAELEAGFATIVADEAEERRLTEVIERLSRSLAAIEPGIAQVEGQLAFVAEAKTAIEQYAAAARGFVAEGETYGLLMKAFHVSGIPTLIVENGVAAIEERANEVLGRLPQDFRIELRTQRERVKGGAMDALDVVVTTSGRERDFEGLSVGQQFRVNLALRLGLSAVIAERSGTRIDTLWLDEPLADLDEEGREAAVEALGALAGDFPLIVVVSHHPEFNDRFQSTITVEQDSDGISTARLA